MPISKAEKLAYRQKLNRLVRDFERLDAETVRALQGLAANLRKSIHEQLLAIAQGGDKRLSPAQVELLRDHVSSQTALFQRQARDILQRGMAGAQELGSTASMPAMDLLGMIPSTIPAPSPSITAIALEYSADLIRQISEETRTKINGELTRAILGELNPYDAMKQVDNAIGIGKDVGVSAKAEQIVRTEVGRAYSMEQERGMKSVTDRLDPDLRKFYKKRWISSRIPGRTRPEHWEADGQVVPIDKPFIVGGEELDFPRDPKGSPGNTINCMCHHEEFIDDVLDEMERQEAETTL